MPEIPTRTLIQERTILVAKQGDPKSPAPGSLLARQKILHEELELANERNDDAQRAANDPHADSAMMQRHVDVIRRDIRRIETELIAVQDRLREIEVAVSEGQDKRRN